MSLRSMALATFNGLKVGDRVHFDKNGKTHFGKVSLVHGDQFEVRWDSGATGSFSFSQAVDNGIAVYGKGI